MGAKEEIEFLMRLREESQKLVDKLTLRIVELQNPKNDNAIGFKNEKKD